MILKRNKKKKYLNYENNHLITNNNFPIGKFIKIENMLKIKYFISRVEYGYLNYPSCNYNI